MITFREVKSADAPVDDIGTLSISEINAQAAAISPGVLIALSLLAACCEAMGNVDERDRALERVRAINASHAGAYLELARISERRRRVPAAVEWAQKAIGADILAVESELPLSM